MDNNGNFFGTSKYFTGVGVLTATVFKLTPDGSGGYVESVAHLFSGGSDGTGASGLIADDRGNLYGTTYDGGSNGCGSVFQLSPDGSGGYVNSIIHGFAGGLSDGCSLMGGVILDNNGNLFGTTADGGAHGNGTAFKLTPNGSGGFVETILYDFAGGLPDGAQPQSSLVIDRNGNLFGTTTAGGAHGYGTVFELIPNGSGGYSESLLYSFIGGTSDGAVPSGLIIDSSGNLFGTTVDGGSSGVGAVFEIAH